MYSMNPNPIFRILIVTSLMVCSLQTVAQTKYFTRNGTVTFFSSAPLEDITADNRSVTAILDLETGALEFSALMRSFNFKKALMQEHFNENYVESDQFPKAVFKGKIVDIGRVDFDTPGTYPVTVDGDLSLHGVSQPLKTEATLEVGDQGIFGHSEFIARPADYDIEIPNLVRDKIGKEIKVTVEVQLTPFER